MDSFYTTDGSDAMGYYGSSALSYYYALADSFTLCGNYFCSVLGPSDPNRIALWTGTCGGITRNVSNNATLDWPTIVDLLDQYHVTLKCYNLGLGMGSELNDIGGNNPLAYFKKWQNYQPLLPTLNNYCLIAEIAIMLARQAALKPSTDPADN